MAPRLRFHSNTPLKAFAQSSKSNAAVFPPQRSRSSMAPVVLSAKLAGAAARISTPVPSISSQAKTPKQFARTCSNCFLQELLGVFHPLLLPLSSRPKPQMVALTAIPGHLRPVATGALQPEMCSKSRMPSQHLPVSASSKRRCCMLRVSFPLMFCAKYPIVVAALDTQCNFSIRIEDAIIARTCI
jgi:hypothetical protein